jgi:GNAT superfamily N-acetyltransferase
MATTVPGVLIRDMTDADLGDGLRLSRASGWNQTLEDWRCLLRLGPGLFRVATREGRVVGCGGAVVYGGELAWICMILVLPEARGRGVGTRAFEDVLGRALRLVAEGRLRSVGLDATPAGRGIYAQRGFRDGAPAGIRRMRAERSAGRAPDGVRALTEADLPEVFALDRRAFGADRSALLRWALAHAPELAWVRRSGGTLAYGFGRHGDHSDHVGPVVAADLPGAKAILDASLSRPRSRPLILDARADPAWLDALGGLGFREARPFTRMYAGDARPDGRPSLEPAVFGPEFG